jgi:hypothetical protein
VSSRVTIHLPGEPPREILLEDGASETVSGTVRLAGCEAPGVVVEGTGSPVRLEGRRLRPGERVLLRPGQVATVGEARIEVARDDPGTAAGARALLRSALRGDPAWGGPELLAIAGPAAGRRFPVRAGLLGRGAGAAIRIDDPTVSRRHARLALDGGRVRVADLGSRNGSWVGPSRLVGMREVAAGDELRAGRTVLVLGLDPPGSGPAHRTGPGSTRAVRAALLATALLAAAGAALLAP